MWAFFSKSLDRILKIDNVFDKKNPHLLHQAISLVRIDVRWGIGCGVDFASNFSVCVKNVSEFLLSNLVL